MLKRWISALCVMGRVLGKVAVVVGVAGVPGVVPAVWATGYSVAAVGASSYGRLGSNNSLPGAALTGNVMKIAAGFSHSLLLKTDGTVWACGDNVAGELGDGTTANSGVPVRVKGLSGVVDVAGGYRFSLAVKNDGTVWAWGSNLSGELGDGTIVDRSMPVQVSGLSDVVAASAGGAHSLALKRDGTVWAWGLNGAGQLGNGTHDTNPHSAPVQVLGLSAVAAVAGTWQNSLAVKSDGTAWAWGVNIHGELGQGTSDSIAHSTPEPVPGLAGVVSMSGGEGHCLALTSDGAVWTWGWNWCGQSGNGADGGGFSPVQVSGLSGVMVAVGGSVHNLAVKSDGAVWAWGDNSAGELGNGTVRDGYVPVQTTWLSGVVAVAVGSGHSLALRSDGTVWAWGYNNFGELGNGTTAGTAAAVSGVSDVVAVAGGSDHSLAVMGDGTVRAWGYNKYGQLGNGTSNYDPQATPLQVSGLSGVLAAAAGRVHSLAVKNDGTVWTWGDNQYGQLGNGVVDYTPHSTPGRVLGVSGVVGVAGGSRHSVSLKSDGTVWAWGYNHYGQLGNGTTGDSLVPVQVLGLGGVVEVACGSHHSVSLKSDGTVWAWGYNGWGQLGNGTHTNSAVPVQVSGLSGVVDVAAAGDGVGAHSLAVKSDGTVWAWGHNYTGQLGDGTTTSSAVPVQVSGLSDVVAVSAGGETDSAGAHSLAVKSDGTAWAWGYNVTGQLGTGTTTGSTVPVRVSGLSGVVAVACGDDHTLFLGGFVPVAPTVVGVWPGNGTIAGTVRTIVACFSKSVANVSPDDLQLSAGTATAVASGDGCSYVFTVTGVEGAIIATVGGNITDGDGRPLAPFTWSFSTGPAGACCAADGTCSWVMPANCTGVYQGDGTNCSPSHCPQPGACCRPDGSCYMSWVVGGCPEGGTYRGNGTTCASTPCPQPGACCQIDGTCYTASVVGQCGNGGSYQGDGTSCSLNPCPPVGACCAADGSCAVRTPGGMQRRRVPGCGHDMFAEPLSAAAGGVLPLGRFVLCEREFGPMSVWRHVSG